MARGLRSCRSPRAAVAGQGEAAGGLSSAPVPAGCWGWTLRPERLVLATAVAGHAAKGVGAQLAPPRQLCTQLAAGQWRWRAEEGPWRRRTKQGQLSVTQPRAGSRAAGGRNQALERCCAQDRVPAGLHCAGSCRMRREGCGEMGYSSISSSPRYPKGCDKPLCPQYSLLSQRLQLQSCCLGK